MGENLVEHQLFLQIVSGTIENVISAFLVAKTSEGLSPRTLKLYSWELHRFSAWLGQVGVVTIEELNADSIRKYLLQLSETRNAASCHIFYRIIKTLTLWYEKETDGDYRSPIHKIKPPKLNTQPLPGLSIEQLQALIGVCKTQRDKALFLFLADTGLRASELCSLTVANIQLLTGAVTVEHGKGDKRRVTYIGQRARQELRRYLKTRQALNQDAPLFATDENGRFSYNGLRSLMLRRGADAGIEVSLHDFRRFFAITMLRNGTDVITLSRLMGHSGLEVLKRYLNQIPDDLGLAHKKASPVDNSCFD